MTEHETLHPLGSGQDVRSVFSFGVGLSGVPGCVLVL